MTDDQFGLKETNLSENILDRNYRSEKPYRKSNITV